jgi:hypothetical protein
MNERGNGSEVTVGRPGRSDWRYTRGLEFIDTRPIHVAVAGKAALPLAFVRG